jgi:GT2 family glycosyltransferase
MYGEDVDLCIRAKREGIHSYYWPDTEIYHHVSASIGGNWNPKKIKMKYISTIRLWFKHYLNKSRKIDE